VVNAKLNAVTKQVGVRIVEERALVLVAVAVDMRPEQTHQNARCLT